MTSDTFVKQRTLVLVSLKAISKGFMNANGKLTVGKTLAMSWLPVTERARSTIIARRALVLSGLVLEL
jgi:hypothetical protein